MSKKRTSPESSDDQPTNKDSVSVFQQAKNAKRAKRISSSDTTLQDLPIELFERILVKAVVMEVKGMKLEKSERNEKADFVISRLRTVCSQWNNILTTNFFRNELHRTLDAQKTIRLEILHQPRHRCIISGLTTMKDEIFVLYEQNYGLPSDFAIDVYDRNNMAVVKDVIPLPEICPLCIEACSVSNCVYILHKVTDRRSYIGIFRITKDEKHQFNVTPLITDVWMSNPRPTLSVAADGSLIFSRVRVDKIQVICIYNANGSVQREMKMHSDIPEFSRIIPRPNGNLVLVSTNYQMQTTLTEIDMKAKIKRQYQTSSLGAVSVCNARMYERMMLIDCFNRVELLDSDLNFLDGTGPQLNESKYCCNPRTSHFNMARNELVATVHDAIDYRPHYYYLKGLLTIFRFTEE